MLTISMIHSETADVLSVEDNGIGVKKYDLPYIFQKGFTGDSTDSRKKATGRGLYLTGHREMKVRVPEAFMMKGDFWLCKVRNYIKTNLTKRK